LDEVDIYTDGSRSSTEEGDFIVGCAIVILQFNRTWPYKLNNLSSPFTAKTIAIDKVLELVKSYSWSNVNIYSDSLSLLQALETCKSHNPFSLNNLIP